jgi:hypothetical protein
VATTAGVVVLAFALASASSNEMRARRDDGFCRERADLVGVEPRSELSLWPLGDRCFLDFDDGTRLESAPGWWLTAFAAVWVPAVVVGLVAGSGTARRRTAWILLVPTLLVAALIVSLVPVPPLQRFVAFVTIAIQLGLVPGLLTGAGVWATLRGNPRTTTLASVTAWALALAVLGRGGLDP